MRELEVRSNFFEYQYTRLVEMFPEDFASSLVDNAKQKAEEYPQGEIQYMRWWLNEFIDPLLLGKRISKEIANNK